MERTHGQLSARLADRLRRDNANSLTHIHRCAAGQITSVTLAANAVWRFAGQNRTNLHFLDSGRIDAVHMPFLNHVAGCNNHGAIKLLQILSRGAAQNTNGQRCHNLTGVDNRPHPDAAL